MSAPDPVLGPVAAYYAGKVAQHGPTPAGVDWNSRESQELRFAQLARAFEPGGPWSVLDYGCGYGALLAYLRAAGISCSYTGYDIVPAMLERGREAFSGDAGVTFVEDVAGLAPHDYVFASGTFNVRLQAGTEAWERYLWETLDQFARLARRAFAFNVLSLYSDPGRRRPDLYYADPVGLFEACRRRYSRRVALLHDYPLYECTILVRL